MRAFWVRMTALFSDNLAAGNAAPVTSIWPTWLLSEARWRLGLSATFWNLAREQRAAQVTKAFHLEPKQYQYSEQMLANKDIDAVMIATGDFQHAKLCTEVVRAGKDCYVEKPFANDLDEAKEARDSAKQSKQVVQMGTQHRSEPYPLAVREIIRSGRIGKIVHIEQEWNVNEERWRFVPDDVGISHEMLMDTKMEWKRWMSERKSKLREEDTDWKRWLLGRPYRPFDRSEE